MNVIVFIYFSYSLNSLTYQRVRISFFLLTEEVFSWEGGTPSILDVGCTLSVT